MKGHLKSAGLAVAMVLTGLLLAAPGPSCAQGLQHFTDSSLRGNYGFSFDGTLATSNGQVPLSAVGQVQFDGNGTAPSAVRTIQIGNTVFHQTAVGTYTVNADGTGSAQFEVTTVDPANALPVSTEHFEFVVEHYGSTLQFISTTPGVVARGRLERQ